MAGGQRLQRFAGSLVVFVILMLFRCGGADAAGYQLTCYKGVNYLNLNRIRLFKNRFEYGNAQGASFTYGADVKLKVKLNDDTPVDAFLYCWKEGESCTMVVAQGDGILEVLVMYSKQIRESPPPDVSNAQQLAVAKPQNVVNVNLNQKSSPKSSKGHPDGKRTDKQDGKKSKKISREKKNLHRSSRNRQPVESFTGKSASESEDSHTSYTNRQKDKKKKQKLRRRQKRHKMEARDKERRQATDKDLRTALNVFTKRLLTGALLPSSDESESSSEGSYDSVEKNHVRHIATDTKKKRKSRKNKEKSQKSHKKEAKNLKREEKSYQHDSRELHSLSDAPLDLEVESDTTKQALEQQALEQQSLEQQSHGDAVVKLDSCENFGDFPCTVETLYKASEGRSCKLFLDGVSCFKVNFGKGNNTIYAKFCTVKETIDLPADFVKGVSSRNGERVAFSINKDTDKHEVSVDGGTGPIELSLINPGTLVN